MFDEKNIKKISPEYWRNSHLSLAKYSGEVRINGTIYVLDPQTDYLVREDIYKQEQTERKLSKKQAQAEKKRLKQRAIEEDKKKQINWITGE